VETTPTSGGLRGLLLKHAPELREERPLPWRGAGALPDLSLLVEGLLLVTRAETVVASFARVFQGVETAEDWLRLHPVARIDRLRTGGLVRQKEKLVSEIAMARARRGPVPGGYVGAVYGLRHGVSWVSPTSDSIARVATRLGVSAQWFARIVIAGANDDAAGGDMSQIPVAEPPGYVALGAALDVAALFCRTTETICAACSLASLCATARRGGA